eukprot:24482-Pelagococcus_subviridis.AAC.1
MLREPPVLSLLALLRDPRERDRVHRPPSAAAAGGGDVRNPAPRAAAAAAALVAAERLPARLASVEVVLVDGPSVFAVVDEIVRVVVRARDVDDVRGDV